MEFRPCIDIHNGKVKQIVGSSLKDAGDEASENFVSVKGAAYYAGLYKEKGLRGGHVILLNARDSEYYEATKAAAFEALAAFPQGLQAGGGITAENAPEFIAAGADKVIVTSYIFSDGKLQMDKLKKLTDAVGRERIVIDLSCRFKDDDYYVVTDRWQKFTSDKVDNALFDRLGEYCAEFLIHGVDVEGKKAGIDERLISILCGVKECELTYAGGISEYDDIDRIKNLSGGRLHFTVGSALDLFGGKLSFDRIVQMTK